VTGGGSSGVTAFFVTPAFTHLVTPAFTHLVTPAFTHLVTPAFTHLVTPAVCLAGGGSNGMDAE